MSEWRPSKGKETEIKTHTNTNLKHIKREKEAFTHTGINRHIYRKVHKHWQKDWKATVLHTHTHTQRNKAFSYIYKYKHIYTKKGKHT